MENKTHKHKMVEMLVNAMINERWSVSCGYYPLDTMPSHVFQYHPRTNSTQPSTENDSCIINPQGIQHLKWSPNGEWEMPKWEYVFIDRDSNKIELKEQEYPKQEHKIPVIDGESKMMYFKLSNILHSDKVAYYMEVYRDE